MLGGAQGYQVNDVNGLTNAFKGLVIQAGKKGRKKRRARQIKRSPADVVSHRLPRINHSYLFSLTI